VKPSTVVLRFAHFGDFARSTYNYFYPPERGEKFPGLDGWFFSAT
jgi:hypothetical protein